MKTAIEKRLTTAILEHIFTNLGVFGGYKASITDKAFKLPETIPYEIETGKDEAKETKNALIYACRSNLSGKKIDLIFSRFYQWNGIEDHDAYLLVRLEGSPAYGCFLDVEMTKINYNDPLSSDGFLGVQFKEKTWMEATPFLKATFLAGMEQMREMTTQFEKNDKPEEMIELLKEFIGFYDTITETTNNEGNTG
jgi:hypothetical protein